MVAVAVLDVATDAVEVGAVVCALATYAIANPAHRRQIDIRGLKTLLIQALST